MGPGRTAWLDLARALSIVLVVLLHVDYGLVHGPHPVDDFWLTVNQMFVPLRIPLFFFVSGLLAAPLLTRPPRAVGRRVLTLAYLYLLWGGILLATRQIFGPPDEAWWLARLLVPSSGYWYLWAAGAFLLLAFLTRSLPGWAVVAAAGLVAICNDAFLTPAILRFGADTHLGSMAGAQLALSTMVFFMIGIRFPQITRLIERARWTVVAPAWPILFVAAYLWTRDLPLGPDLRLATLPVIGCAFVITACMTAFLLCRNPSIARFGLHLGSRTLPVYLVQFPLLVILAPLSVVSTNAWLQAIMPLVWTGLFVAIALLLFSATRGNPLRFLFTAPFPSRRRTAEVTARSGMAEPTPPSATHQPAAPTLNT